MIIFKKKKNIQYNVKPKPKFIVLRKKAFYFLVQCQHRKISLTSFQIKKYVTQTNGGRSCFYFDLVRIVLINQPLERLLEECEEKTQEELEGEQEMGKVMKLYFNLKFLIKYSRQVNIWNKS